MQYGCVACWRRPPYGYDENHTRFNPVGARGIGEIGITGIPAAIANAVYHATGRRVRKLPILLEDLYVSDL